MGKIISIDIETSGLDYEWCQILEFGAVIEDTNNQKKLEDLPSFHTYVVHDKVVGQPFALAMNANILKRIANLEPPWTYLTPEGVVKQFQRFLWLNEIHDAITVAGKNYGMFDHNFIKKLPNFMEDIKVKHRVIDPAMLYWNSKTDVELPNMKECMKRAGITGEVAHTAVEDAKMVIKLLRKKHIILY